MFVDDNRPSGVNSSRRGDLDVAFQSGRDDNQFTWDILFILSLYAFDFILAVYMGNEHAVMSFYVMAGIHLFGQYGSAFRV